MPIWCFCPANLGPTPPPNRGIEYHHSSLQLHFDQHHPGRQWHHWSYTLAVKKDFETGKSLRFGTGTPTLPENNKQRWLVVAQWWCLVEVWDNSELNWNKRDFLPTTTFWKKSVTCSHKTSLSTLTIWSLILDTPFDDQNQLLPTSTVQPANQLISPSDSPKWSPAPSTTAEQPALRTPKRSPTVPLKKTF